MEDAGSVVRWIVAVFAGFLPRALWPSLEGAFFPIHLASVPSAALQLIAGFVLGLPSFLIYAWRVANTNTDLMLAAASRQQQTRSGPAVTSAMSVAPSMFSLFAFLFFTPAGLASLYLATAGLVRLVSAIVEEPFGDPLLTGVHRLGVRLRARRTAAIAAERRASLEGAEIPDRHMPGAEAGVPAAELVVISARRKAGWEEGVLVVTDRGWFRIGRIFEEYHDGGLRTLYPLVRSPESEVMRRAVTYDLPPPAGGEPASEPPSEGPRRPPLPGAPQAHTHDPEAPQARTHDDEPPERA